MRPMIKFIILLFISVYISGCGMHSSPSPVLKDPRVRVISAHEIKVTQVATRINSADFMEVQVNGKTSALGFTDLEYKVEWIDRDGFILKTIMSEWTSFPAYKGTPFNFNAIAPSDKAADFRITIRKKEGNHDNEEVRNEK